MSDYTWQDFLSLGVPDLDDQHRRLIGIANDFMDAVRAGDKEDAVRRAAQSLVQYAGEHFAAEERFMESMAYPDLEDHRQAHRALRNKAGRMLLRIEAGKDVPSRDMDVLVKTWLLDHILNKDLKIAEFLAETGQFGTS